MTPDKPQPRAADAVPPIGRSLLFSPWAALRFQLVDLPREFGHRTGLSRRLMTVVLLLLFGGVGSLGAYGYNRRMQERSGVTANREWREFEMAAELREPEKMKKVLARIAALNPGDPRVAERRATMESLEADPADQVMIQYCMVEHYNRGQRVEFHREANKRLAASRGDWRALCLLAEDALRHGERARAAEFLRQLPPPDQAIPPPDINFLQLAFELTRQLDLPNDIIRDHLILRDLPAIKNKALAAQSPSIVKFNYFRLYVKSYGLLGRPQDLTPFWVPYGDLCRLMLEDPEIPIAMLNETGELLNRQLAIFDELVRAKQFPAEEVEGLRAELLERLKICWTRVRELEPTNPRAYCGLAWVNLRRDQGPEARAMLEEGLKACGDKPELIQLMTDLLRKGYRDPAAALERARQAVERNPDNPALLGILIENAKASGRLDLVLEACAKARAKLPGNLWICREEASVWLEQNRPSNVIAALADVMDQVAADPVAIRIYVTALCRSGSRTEVEKFVAALGEGAKKPDLWCEGLSAANLEGMPSFAVAGAEKITAKWSEYLPGWRLLGDAHANLADPAEGRGWDKAQATLAIRAYERYLKANPKDEAVANMVVWLCCKALRQYALADPYAVVLREAEARHELKNSRRETLAVWHLGNNRAEEARRILEELVKAEPTVPGYFIHLGLAYDKAGRREEAKACFEKAGSLPKSNWETVELDLAVQLFEKGF